MPYYTVVATNTNDPRRVKRFTGIRVRRDGRFTQSHSAAQACEEVLQKMSYDRRWHLAAFESKAQARAMRRERYLEKHVEHRIRADTRSIWAVAAVARRGRLKSLNNKVLVAGDNLDYKILYQRAMDFMDRLADENLAELQRRSAKHHLDDADRLGLAYININRVRPGLSPDIIENS